MPAWFAKAYYWLQSPVLCTEVDIHWAPPQMTITWRACRGCCISIRLFLCVTAVATTSTQCITPTCNSVECWDDQWQHRECLTQQHSSDLWMYTNCITIYISTHYVSDSIMLWGVNASPERLHACKHLPTIDLSAVPRFNNHTVASSSNVSVLHHPVGCSLQTCAYVPVIEPSVCVYQYEVGYIPVNLSVRC